MPDLRKDPIVGRWVIIAKNRAKRPLELTDGAVVDGKHGFCPFCEGHEEHTPHEIAAYRASGTQKDHPGWRVRVVPNKFPALEIEGDLNKRGQGMYDMMRGVGAHEVIIESPAHLRSTTDLSADNLRDVLMIYRDRLVDLKRDQRLVYGMIFKNAGAAAGASLEHTHSQLIVTPIVPINVAEEIAGSQAFYRYRGRCVFCDMIEQELAFEKRIVFDSPGFVAFCPFAARFPFETWILPTSHASHYESLTRSGAEELARVMKRVLGKIETALDRPAYNYIIHTAPFDTQSLGHYHWHMEIIPRVTKTAGFEWGSGFYINPVPPEDAATFMRELVKESQEAQEIPARTTG
jgi:UDPglucose--hexose-1-phosphate uridylyltransferase